MPQGFNLIGMAMAVFQTNSNSKVAQGYQMMDIYIYTQIFRPIQSASEFSW